ncbi:hypothetical protein KCU65_g5687, partial [Aureobasidium melanogenum]
MVRTTKPSVLVERKHDNMADLSVRCDILYCQSSQGSRDLQEPLRQLLMIVLEETPWEVDAVNYRGTNRVIEALFRRPGGYEDDRQETEALFKLCDVLSGPNLEAALETFMQLHPIQKPRLIQSPASEGTMGIVDRKFAQCYSITVLERYAEPQNMVSMRLQAKKKAFMGRNPTKYVHHILSGINTVAAFTETTQDGILMMCHLTDQAKNASASRKKYFNRVRNRAFGENSSLVPNGEETLALAITILEWWTQLAPAVKKATAPYIETLNTLVILHRLKDFRTTFLLASRAPQQALDRLASQGPGQDLDEGVVVSLINSFGTLMQCLDPLFKTTLDIADSDFIPVASYSSAAAVSLAAFVGLFFVPVIGLGTALAIGAAGGAAGGTSYLAITEGIRWGKKRDLDPSVTLLLMVKSMEENLVYLRNLGYVNGAFDAVGDERNDRQHDIFLNGTTPFDPQQRRAYMQNEAQTLRNNLMDLRKGLDACEQELFERTREEIRAEEAGRSTPANG